MRRFKPGIFILCMAYALLIVSGLLGLEAKAGTVPVKVSLPCGGIMGPCPSIVFYSRDYPAATAKVLAAYQPGRASPTDVPTWTLCTYNSSYQWRIGHPKDGVTGFRVADWQDVNIIMAKPSVANNMRWGDCCVSAPNNTVCLN